MKKLTVTTLFLTVWLSSCTHYYYVPSVQNVPLFREKNEYRLPLTHGRGDESICTEVQAAYSVTGNIGVMTNFMWAKSEDVSNNTNWGKGHYLDGAIGYYKPSGKYGVFEFYGGFGLSNQHHQYESYNYNIFNSLNRSGSIYYYFSGTSDLSFTKLFIQPSFGLTFKGFDFAISTRLCRLSFDKIDNQIKRQIDKYEFDNL